MYQSIYQRIFFKGDCMDTDEQSDYIDVSMSDLESEDNNIISIDSDDLNSVSDNALSISNDDLSGMSDDDTFSKKYKQIESNPVENFLRKLQYRNLVVISGFISGLFIAIISAILFSCCSTMVNSRMILFSGLFSAIIATFSSFFIVFFPEYAGGSKRKGFIDGYTISILAALAAFVAGAVAQYVYVDWTSNFIFPSHSLILLRGLSWSVIGLFIGAITGFNSGSIKNTGNAMIGGIIGGMAGGVLFELIKDSSLSENVVRSLSIIILVTLVAVAISFISSLAQEGILHIVTGPLKGKQFPVYENSTLIGSSFKCNIVIIKDRKIEPFACRIIKKDRGLYLVSMANRVVVNGSRVNEVPLSDNASINIGNTLLKFEIKK